MNELPRRIATWVALATCLSAVFAAGQRNAIAQSSSVLPVSFESPSEEPISTDSAQTGSVTPSVNQIMASRQAAANRRAEAARKLSEATQRQAPEWLVTSLKYEAEQLKF